MITLFFFIPICFAHRFYSGTFVANPADIISILLLFLLSIIADIAMIIHAIKEVGLGEATHSKDILDDEAPTDNH